MKTLNSFERTLLYLGKSQHSSLFEEQIHTAYETQNFDELDYSLGQLLEPSVLNELSITTKISVENLQKLNHPFHGKLQWLIQNRDFLHNQSRLNLALFLMSICRYQMSIEELNKINPQELSISAQLDYQSAKFMAHNRLEEYDKAHDALEACSHLINHREIKASKKINLIAFAIVWNIKTPSVSSTAIMDRFISQEESSIEELTLTGGFEACATLSNYYRAVAMRNISPTQVRKTMQLSLRFADSLSPTNARQAIVKKQLLKTCYESTIKEHLYVSGDFVAAEEAAKKLIEMDPLWSISWAELGEVYKKQSRLRKAAEAYEMAVNIGAPRVPHHLYQAALCRYELKEHSRCLKHLKKLLTFEPKNESVLNSIANVQKESLNDQHQAI